MISTSYLIVGHGGQGVLDLGNFIAYDGILHDMRIAYTPSYGPETRGGKVRCYVVTSEESIDSPIVDEPDVLVAMNNPSMDFENVLKEKGLLLMNLSLIDRLPRRKDVEVFGLPATDMAYKLKDQGVELADTRVLQNSVMYGATLAAQAKPFDQQILHSVLEHVYPGTKSKFIPANARAVELGYSFVIEHNRTNPPHCGC
ncbi:MAG TPA: 2-oxoacid:acceptor oxidoreductase family protein [Candidatus Bathyarchaeia archaeon]|nr:2-oxoacid:acceptor oxidoreductase family protein [Candidatus Bathyarchaeia archaeon]